MNLVAKYRLGGAALDTGMEDQVQLSAMRNVALAPRLM